MYYVYIYIYVYLMNGVDSIWKFQTIVTKMFFLTILFYLLQDASLYLSISLSLYIYIHVYCMCGCVYIYT